MYGINIDTNRVIMIGKVSAVYPEKATARVLFEDRDSDVSDELPILFTRAFGCEVYAMPEVGEEVMCIFLPNGIENGFIVGGYYNENNKAPTKDGAIKLIRFKDGNYVEYNESTKTMTLKADKILLDGEVVATGTVTSSKFIGDLQGLADRAKEADDN